MIIPFPNLRPRAYFRCSEAVVFLWIASSAVGFVYPGLGAAMIFQPSSFFQGAWWTLVTYVFADPFPGSMIICCLGFVLIGPSLEKITGSWEFLLFCAFSALIPGLFGLAGVFLFPRLLLGGPFSVAAAVYFTASVLYADDAIGLFGTRIRLPLLALLLAAAQTLPVLWNVTAYRSFLPGLFVQTVVLPFAWLYCLLRLKRNPADILISLFRR